MAKENISAQERIQLKKDIEGYKPYKGGSGPGQHQIEKNDKALLAKLKLEGIPAKYEIDEEWSDEMGYDPKFKTVNIRAHGITVRANFDRYGFVIDELSGDQEDLESAYKIIKNWYETGATGEEMMKEGGKIYEPSKLEFNIGNSQIASLGNKQIDSKNFDKKSSLWSLKAGDEVTLYNPEVSPKKFKGIVLGFLGKTVVVQLSDEGYTMIDIEKGYHIIEAKRKGRILQYSGGMMKEGASIKERMKHGSKIKLSKEKAQQEYNALKEEFDEIERESNRQLTAEDYAYAFKEMDEEKAMTKEELNEMYRKEYEGMKELGDKFERKEDLRLYLLSLDNPMGKLNYYQDSFTFNREDPTIGTKITITDNKDNKVKITEAWGSLDIHIPGKKEMFWSESRPEQLNEINKAIANYFNIDSFDLMRLDEFMRQENHYYPQDPMGSPSGYMEEGDRVKEPIITYEVLGEADERSKEFLGNSLKGSVNATYEEIINSFGQPTETMEKGGHSQATWDIIFSDGLVASIYDWNQFDKDKEQVDRWNIGAKDSRVLERIQNILATPVESKYRRGGEISAEDERTQVKSTDVVLNALMAYETFLRKSLRYFENQRYATPVSKAMRIEFEDTIKVLNAKAIEGFDMEEKETKKIVEHALHYYASKLKTKINIFEGSGAGNLSEVFKNELYKVNAKLQDI